MLLASLIIDVVTAICTVILILFAVYMPKDAKRKAQQYTIEVYQHLQTNALSHISHLKTSEVKRVNFDYKSIVDEALSFT